MWLQNKNIFKWVVICVINLTIFTSSLTQIWTGEDLCLIFLLILFREPKFHAVIIFAKSLKVKDKEDCSRSVSFMLCVPADTSEGLKEGTQPLQGLPVAFWITLYSDMASCTIGPTWTHTKTHGVQIQRPKQTEVMWRKKYQKVKVDLYLEQWEHSHSFCWSLKSLRYITAW